MNGDPSLLPRPVSLPCPEVEEALPAYALGVLDGDERAAVEAHLVDCAACRVGLAPYEGVVGALGMAVAPSPPKPAGRARLLAAARDTRHRRAPWPARIAAAVRSLGDRAAALAVPPPLGFGLAAAAVLLVTATAVLGVLLAQTNGRLEDVRVDQREVAEYLRNGGVLAALQPAPGAPAEAEPGLGALAVAPNQPGAMLVVYDLPPPAPGQRYETWAARGTARTPLGELRVDEEGAGWLYLSAKEPMTAFDTVGISRVTSAAPGGVDFLVAKMPGGSG